METHEFNHKEIESRWQKRWEEERIFEPNLDKSKKPFYNLMMFPYPSAEGLHVGNMYAFCGSDVFGRYMRMKGFDVFEPIGLDGFGIHSENYALKINKHPMEVAKRTEANFYRQLRATGNAYSWSNKLETYKSNYYKWTQWIFIQLFKAGLAYRSKSAVNWCPHCLTVLADEQVIRKSDKSEIRNSKSEIWVCERCGTKVEKRELEQWFFRITAYAQRLLDGLERIDWSEKVKIAQRSWLGKSEGAEILFPCDIEKNSFISVFTTRVDTIFGVSFLALAPEYPLVSKILARTKGLTRQQIHRYVSDSLKKSEEERVGQFQKKEGKIGHAVKTGVDTHFHATNPVNGKKVPVYIADYVLGSYGAGAVMGVPAHDQRDWDFAKSYGLEIVQVIRPKAASKEYSRKDINISQKAYKDYGVLVNSGKFTGLTSEDGIRSISKYIEMHHLGSPAATWHLRDWIISRQRYWGPPIPMIFCKSCQKDRKSWFTTDEAKNLGMGISNLKFPISNENSKFKIQNSAQWAAGWFPVPEEDLPVELPFIKNFKPTGTGLSPLAQDSSFVKVNCPNCGRDARRETDVSDTFLDSAWYFFRYTSAEDDTCPWRPERVRKWLPVDMYIGGAEHSVLHLLYSRFLTMAFKDLGLISHFEEPFTKFRAHGLLICKGAKMSKSKGNIVIPDDYIEKYGSDTLRCYLMFCGRYQQGGDFRDSGIEGMSRFLRRIWRLVGNWASGQLGIISKGPEPNSQIAKEPNSLYLMHKTIKKVTEDIESLDYNTAISVLMEWMNALEARTVHSKSQKTVNSEPITRVEVETLLLLLAPFAPHITEELWQRVRVNSKSKIVNRKEATTINNSQFSIHVQKWPKYDHELATAQRIVLVVEVNGKVRDKINVARGITEAEAKKLALSSFKATKYLDQKKIKKVIFVPDRLINFVI